jgi:putative FmdB family regulatory protein
MPIYEFECPNGTIIEKLSKMGTTEIECTKCHRTAKRVTSLCTFILKGGGWYADGYASKLVGKTDNRAKKA